jgi:aspartate aminotransferase
MTGWRIGYTAGPSNIIQAMDNIQSQSTSNPTSISQKAAITALQGSSEGINEMVKEFDRRRRFGVEQLNQIRGVVCFNPPGAFYLFPDVSKYLGRSFQGKKMNNSSDLVEFLLENAQIALVPGEAFGAPKHIRISYATSLENLKEALKRLEQSLSKLS